MILPTPIFAALDACQKNDFFGLVPWYHYLKLDASCDVRTFTIMPSSKAASDVPLVLLAVVDDVIRIAGIVAVAFVLVGAFKLVISQGNADQTASARSTIINALLGLAISVVAVTFVGFLGNRLGG